MDPLSVGRSCYKQKDYEGALEAFTEGIKISTDHIRLTALDHRAATFEKLNRLQAGLRDAKEMIEMKPGLAKVLPSSVCIKLLFDKRTANPTRAI